jgi:hypothetical protein
MTRSVLSAGIEKAAIVDPRHAEDR